MNTFMPWFVTFVVLWVIGCAVYVTSLHPVTGYDIFLLLMMSGSGAVIVMGYFRIYAIFERMDRREEEWLTRERAIKNARKWYP